MGWGGVVSFSKMRTFARGDDPSSVNMHERGRRGAQKEQFYANVIIESPPTKN